MTNTAKSDDRKSPVLILISGVISAFIITLVVVLTFTLKIRPNRNRNRDPSGTNSHAIALDSGQYSPVDPANLPFTHSVHTNLNDDLSHDSVDGNNTITSVPRDNGEGSNTITTISHDGVQGKYSITSIESGNVSVIGGGGGGVSGGVSGGVAADLHLVERRKSFFPQCEDNLDHHQEDFNPDIIPYREGKLLYYIMIFCLVFGLLRG